ncbi:MAG: diguanylate cyclase [Burkholderiales bacterium]
MVEVDAELERADRQRQARERAQRQRLRWVALIASSYALDVLFLALYAGAGTIPARVAVAYGGAGFAFCLVYALFVASGLNLRLRDPTMGAPGMLWGVLAQLLVVALAPQITFPYIVNLFTVFAFGMLWLRLRQAVALWALAMAGSGAVLYLNEGRLGVAGTSDYELMLTWLFLSVILSRTLVLAIYSNGLRARLGESRSKLASALEQIRELVHYDDLTKSFNRRSLVARLGEELSRSQRTHVPFSVAMLDLDHFKAVNDGYGHATGDEVLKVFAEVAQATMRKTDVFGRYGGEEFLMILTASDKTGAAGAVERVCAAAAAHDWETIAPGLKLTLSAGLADYRQGEGVEQLINRADSALYEAKRAGRNRVVVAQ